MKVTISIPAFNEEKTLAQLLHSIKPVMDKTKYKYDIQVVDDGSTDNTAQVAKSLGAKVYSHPHNYGLAETFRTEIKQFLESPSNILVHIDADNQYLPEDIPRLITEVENGNDLVLGNRFAGGIESMSIIKRLGNMAFSRVISKIIRFKVGDCQTGFRAFNRKVASKITIASDHTYTQEQIIKASREKFKIKEIPVRFLKRSSGKSRLLANPFEYAIKAWINIFRIYRDYEPLKFFGRIGLCFIAAGLLTGSYLVYLFLQYNRIGHTPTIILTALLMIIGIQIWIFGFLADMQRK